jgi:hypothetical protein
MTTTNKKNDNQMETITNTIKTAMISTSNATHESVLQFLNEHKITYLELGKDQKENTIIKLDYAEEQQPIIDEIQLLIGFVEDLVALFAPIVTKCINAFGQEAEYAMQTLENKYGGKHLLDNQVKTSKELKLETDGNNNTNQSNH